MFTSKFLLLYVMLLTALLGVAGAQGQVVISEFVASNQTGLTDEDGAYSDWIELHNRSSSPVDLSGWSLTDDVGFPAKWVFPEVSLAADGYLVVFASGEDRAVAGAELHTNFRLSEEGEYLGLIEPNGVTVASEFHPAYPRQFADISYGIQTTGTNLSLSAGEAGFLIEQTPGTGNSVWPAPHPLFCLGSVARVDMFLSEEAWIRLNTTWLQTSEQVDLRFRHGDIDQTRTAVEVTPRGNTSLDKLPRSFQVSFNSLVPGQSLFDMEKLNLNGEVNDDTSARSLISSELSRKVGTDHIFANQVALVIHLTNGSQAVFFDAIRNNVQSVDDVYMEQRFGTSDANLYKCVYLGSPASLTYRGPDGSAYSSIPDTYQLKYPGGEDSSYDDLAGFISMLNQSSEADFPNEIYEQFDVDTFLKRLCVDVLTGNWDSYWGNYNNFHLCCPPTENRWTYTSYDFDNTLGVNWLAGEDWGVRDIYTWGSLDPSDKPLAARLLHVPEFKIRYSHYMSEILEEAFDTNALTALAYGLRDRMMAPLPFGAPSVSNMKSTERGRYQNQWPYTGYNQFYNAYDWPQQNQDQYALVPYFSVRASSARAQLNWTNPAPVVCAFRMSPGLPAVDAPLYFQAEVIDNTSVTSVVVRYTFDGGALSSQVLSNTAGNTYTASLAAFTQAGTLRYWLEACDDQGRTTYSPFGGSNYAYEVDIGSAARQVRLSELNYHPHDPAGTETGVSDDADDYEFIELQNAGSEAVDLTGWTFSEAVQFTFPDYVLGTGAYVLVVSDVDAFEARYGTGLPVAGTFEGKLSNSGETLVLRTVDFREIWSFEYGDDGSWPGRADGKGSTLERVNLLSDDDSAGAWRSSFEYGGSPGVAGAGPDGRIVINEVLAHTDEPLSDTIELWNSTDEAVDIGGWWLSDHYELYYKYQIPTGTIISAKGYLAFNETNHFNISMGVNSNDFALSGAHGDDVWLLESAPGGRVTGFADHVEFGASANAESMARWPNGQGRLYPAVSRSLCASNTGPRVGPVLISELMYHPEEEEDLLEYVEVYNPGPAAADLSGWALGHEVEYAFPSNQMLYAGEVLLVVPFDPASTNEAATFRAAYNLDQNVLLLGPYTGRLDNAGGRLTLFRADEPPMEEPWFTPLLIEDEVDYADGAPWPETADGAGGALMRLVPAGWGNDASSWTSGVSPGTVLVDTGHVFLTVSSAVAATTPGAGTYRYEPGVTLTNTALALLTNTGSRTVSLGWTCLGHEPAQGEGQSMVMVLTNNAVLTWLWSTEHYVEVGQNAAGWVSPASGWYPEGSSLIISSSPPDGLFFDQWTGQTERISSGSVTSPVVSVALHTPVALYAHYVGRISSASNLLQNPGFEVAGSSEEQAAFWETGVPDTNGAWWGTAARFDWRSHEGEWLGAVRGTWAGLGSEGGFQQTLAARPGPVYSASGYFYASDTWYCTNQVFSMEFLDVQGLPVGGVTNVLQGLDDQWLLKTLEGTAPEGTAWLRVAIQARSVGGAGSLQFDDFTVSYAGIFEPSYQLTTTSGTYGSVSPIGVTSVAGNTLTSVLIRADAYFRIESVSVDGRMLDDLESSAELVYRFGPMWSDHSVAAVFRPLLTADGVPYWWLADQGFTNGDWELLADLDPDEDGLSSGDEYWAGTNPNSDRSVLSATGLEPLPSGRMAIHWSSESNRCYTVSLCDLATGVKTPVVEHVESTPPVNVHTASLETATSGAFTVEVERPFPPLEN